MLLRFGLGAPQIDRLAPQPAPLDAGRQQAALLLRTTQQANGSDLQMMQDQAPCQVEFLLGQAADASEDFPQSRSIPANARGTASASIPLSRRLAAQLAMGRGVFVWDEWSRASLMRHLERGSDGQALARGKQAPVMERMGSPAYNLNRLNPCQ